MRAIKKGFLSIVLIMVMHDGARIFITCKGPSIDLVPLGLQTLGT